MPPIATLLPARLAHTGEDIPYSPDYHDIYHSADGGPGQARQVFLKGNGLPDRWRDRERFVILETGFGTGLNFLTTWAAWRDDPHACRTLHYLAVEKHPFGSADLAILHGRWPELSDLSESLRSLWPVLTPGFHRLALAAGRLHLTLLFGEADAVLARLSARADAVYLDGFAPRNNPAMWSAGVFRRLARLAAPGATLATWCVAAAVRQGLEAVGFRCEKRPGYGRKREMLIGRCAAGPSSGNDAEATVDRRALVVGAGLAGSAVCARLAARGWRVTLIDRHPGPAHGASGNLAGIVRPLPSLDDNLASRFTRAACLHALRTWQRPTPSPRTSDRGVLQIARDAAHEARQREVVEVHRYPPEHVRFLDREAASALAGWPLAQGGWYFPQGGGVHPPSVCVANLAACGDRLTALYQRTLARLERVGGEWRALDALGAPIAAAPVLILANGAEATGLAETAGLPLRRVRGQLTHLPATRLPPLPLALCREGYVTPAVDGQLCAGASYALEEEPSPRPEDDAGNLARLERILPGFTAGLEVTGLTGRVGFRSVAPDRLPLVGPLPSDRIGTPGREVRLADLPRAAGCYGLLGLASRGLVWAELAAELLAARIEGEPLPLETDLVDALDPGRFLLRAMRRGRPVV